MSVWKKPSRTSTRLDDMNSVLKNGLQDENSIEARKVLVREKTRRNVVDRLLSSGEMAVLFSELDTDGNGSLDPDELICGLKKMGFSILVEDAHDLFRQIDTDDTGDISFEEFNAFCQRDLSGLKQKAHEEKVVERNNSKLEYDPRESWTRPVSGFGRARELETSVFGKMANGNALPAGRRTSFAMGHDRKRDIHTAEADFKRKKKRRELRKKLANRMLSQAPGFSSPEKAATNLYIIMMDGSDGPGISFRLLKRYLDRNGLNVMHEDGLPLFESMDIDGNGYLDQVW